MVLSADTENDPDVAGINGASVALSVSDIPFHGPIGAVRVGQVNGNFVINPTYDERRDGNLNLMVVGTAEGIVMIESGAREVDGRDRRPGHRVRPSSRSRRFAPPSATWPRKSASRSARSSRSAIDEAYLTELRSKMGERLLDAVNTEKHPKNESYSLIKQLKDELKGTIPEEDEEGPQEGRQVLRPAARADLPRAGDQGAPPSRWPQVRPDPRHLDRSWRAAAHARVGDLHPRRNPGAGDHHAGHRRRHAAAGGLRGRSQEALHAALQLSAVLGGRSCVPARSRPPRDRARRAGRARALCRVARRKPIGPTPCASSPTFWSRTGHRRWRRSAELRSA